jgi:hypothetical protein
VGEALMAVRSHAVEPPAPVTPASKRLLQRCGEVTCPPGTCRHDDQRVGLDHSQGVAEWHSPPATSTRLQRAGTGASPVNEVPAIVHEVLRSPGQPLDPAARTVLEPRFGHDFSDVRVHADARAAESARAVNALAYTVGRDVVFGAGQYALETTEGRKLMAHELTHVMQQRGQGTGDPKAISSPESAQEREATFAAEAIGSERSSRPTASAGSVAVVHRQPPPVGPGTLAGLTATREAFNNAGAPDGANCAAAKPAALGVDGPAVGQNGMEMIFRINGAIPPGTEFEITRTKATGVWQQDAGVWSRLGGWPAGTSDDHHDADECLTPVAGRIFVVDTPGPGGFLDPTGVAFPNAAAVAATATAAVWKLSFAEWVIARNRPLGIGWTRISSPLLHRWHSIFSVRHVGGVWTRVDTPSGQHNEIKLGGISTAGATP